MAPSWRAAIAAATEFRSWALTGQTTSHAKQYASIMLAFFSSLSSSRRVYASCSCCLPHTGHVERKRTRLRMGAIRFGRLDWTRFFGDAFTGLRPLCVLLARSLSQILHSSAFALT